jgi:hypothetical protein
VSVPLPHRRREPVTLQVVFKRIQNLPSAQREVRADVPPLQVCFCNRKVSVLYGQTVCLDLGKPQYVHSGKTSDSRNEVNAVFVLSRDSRKSSPARACLKFARNASGTPGVYALGTATAIAFFRFARKVSVVVYIAMYGQQSPAER